MREMSKVFLLLLLFFFFFFFLVSHQMFDMNSFCVHTPSEKGKTASTKASLEYHHATKCATVVKIQIGGNMSKTRVVYTNTYIVRSFSLDSFPHFFLLKQNKKKGSIFLLSLQQQLLLLLVLLFSSWLAPICQVLIPPPAVQSSNNGGGRVGVVICSSNSLLSSHI